MWPFDVLSLYPKSVIRNGITFWWAFLVVQDAREMSGKHRSEHQLSRFSWGPSQGLRTRRWNLSVWTADFSKRILDFLEYKDLHYIIACRFNNRIKYNLIHEQSWVEVANGLEISETTYQVNSWDKPRRIIMVRQEIEKRPNAAGKQVRQLKLFEDGNDFGKYRYSCLVTNLRLPPR